MRLECSNCGLVFDGFSAAAPGPCKRCGSTNVRPITSPGNAFQSPPASGPAPLPATRALPAMAPAPAAHVLDAEKLHSADAFAPRPGLPPVNPFGATMAPTQAGGNPFALPVAHANPYSAPLANNAGTPAPVNTTVPLVLAIVTCFLGCTIAGIVAVVMSVQAGDLVKHGLYTEAGRKARQANITSGIGLVVGIVAWILILTSYSDM